MRAIGLTGLAAVVIGALLGLAFPISTAEAATVYQIKQHAGPEATTEDMTCGWHDECSSSGVGGKNGLDWSNADGDQVRWRSKNYRSNSSLAQVGDADPESFNSNVCYRIKVEVTDNDSNNRGYIKFSHTKSPKSSAPLWGDSDGNQQWFWAGVTVGPANELDPDNCPSSGAHVHQQRGNSLWSKNSYWPNYPSTKNNQYVWDNYMFYRIWTLN